MNPGIQSPDVMPKLCPIPLYVHHWRLSIEFFSSIRHRNIEKDNRLRLSYAWRRKRDLSFSDRWRNMHIGKALLFARSRAARMPPRGISEGSFPPFSANKIGQLLLSYDVAEKEGFVFQRSLAKYAYRKSPAVRPIACSSHAAPRHQRGFFSSFLR